MSFQLFDMPSFYVRQPKKTIPQLQLSDIETSTLNIELDPHSSALAPQYDAGSADNISVIVASLCEIKRYLF